MTQQWVKFVWFTYCFGLFFLIKLIILFFSFWKPSKANHYNDWKVVYTAKQNCHDLLVLESSRCCLKIAIFLHFVFQQLVYCYIIPGSSKGKYSPLRNFQKWGQNLYLNFQNSFSASYFPISQEPFYQNISLTPSLPPLSQFFPKLL